MAPIQDDFEVQHDGTAIITDAEHAEAVVNVPVSVAAANNNLAYPLLLHNKFTSHTPEAGINPLVDSAAQIFFLIGELLHGNGQPDLMQLHFELVDEINHFQENVKACIYGNKYMTEYVPTATYALCVTLDDIVAESSWGGQGRWQPYSMVKTFFSEPPSKESFILILERLVMDTDVYIDAIEFMFICLNFGFKCQSGTNPFGFSYEQIENITNALYRRITHCRGSSDRQLSPFPIQPRRVVRNAEKRVAGLPLTYLIMLCCGILLAVYLGKFQQINSFVSTRYQQFSQKYLASILSSGEASESEAANE